MNQKQKKQAVEAAAVGVGIAATALVAYLFFGPNGKKNRKAARGWMLKMKGEVVEQLEKIQHVTEPAYDKIVDAVAARYAKAKTVDKKELEELAADLKKHWKVISKGASAKKKTAKKATPKKK